MGNNGYRSNLSWYCSVVPGLVLPSSGAVSPAVVSPLARATSSQPDA